MKTKIALAAALALSLGTVNAFAHEHGGKAEKVNTAGYAADSQGTIWRTSFDECWKTSFWSEDNVPVICGGEEAPMMEETAQVAPVVAAPVEPEMVTVDRKFALYFDFDSANVGDLSTVVNHIGSLASVESIALTGHADRIGNMQYNDRLSQRRADAVAAALANAGVDASMITTSSMGSRSPVANCSGRGAELIACLRPDRRVDVEIRGMRKN